MGATSTIEKVDTGLVKPGLTDHVEYGVDIEENTVTPYDHIETSKVLHKVDRRLLPMLALLYLIAFLDRGNLGNAKVAGMAKDLKLTGTQYNLAATLFFIPYALLEVPSNVVLKMLRPSRWLAVLVVAWGTVCACIGAVQGYKGLLIGRLFLGVAEAGFFPAATFLISEWYCRFEVQTRMATFYTAASMAGAFSGLLAFAIQKMDGLAGIEGWRWIFIIEGAATAAIGLTVPFLLPDSPERANWLSLEEKKFLRYRLEQDSGTKEGRVETLDHFKVKHLIAAFADWKIWFTIFIFWGNTVPIYAFNFTAPSIIYELGYTAAQAQLMTIPIYVLAVISVLSFSWLADRRKTRWPFIVIPYSIVCVGFVALLSIPHPKYPGLTYFFLFFIPAGCNPGVITLVSWVANNLAPTSKRAVGLAMSLMMANLGGAVGSNIYVEKQKPRYWMGYGISLAFCSFGIVCALVLRWAYKRENEQRDRMSEEEIRAKYTEAELLELGDKSPLYRYVY